MSVNLIDTKVFAGRLKEREELKKSSSGGAFTAISDIFLSNGDAVICSIYNYDTHVVEYKLIMTTADRNSARGSKYMQSKPGDAFLEVVEWLQSNPGKELLFVGMGCQTDGFRKYVEAIGIRDRVTVVDIICHGSPSPKIWREYMKTLGGTIESLTFKDKRNGWMRPTAVARVNGKEVPLNPYVKIFYNRCALRPSCHVCPFATTERKTDITIGDYWHIEEKMPDFFDEMGNSLFLIHTDRGQALFERIKGTIEYRESNTVDCWQKNLEAPTPVSQQRQEFWQDYQKHGVEYIMKKYGTDPMMMRVKRKLKKMIGGGVLVLITVFLLISPKGGQLDAVA